MKDTTELELEEEKMVEEKMSPNTPLPRKETPRAEDDEHEYLFDEEEMRGLDADN